MPAGSFPEQLLTGGYYKTIVSGAIEAFGWEMFLLAAADPVKMEPVLDSIFRRTLFHMEAWARTSAEVIIQHDDFVWTEGPFMHPDIYRRLIIPRYAALWKPLHAAGKKVLFCSDANFMELAEDMVQRRRGWADLRAVQRFRVDGRAVRLVHRPGRQRRGLPRYGLPGLGDRAQDHGPDF